VASSFASGEKVRILDGVFANFTGVVTGVDAERRTLKVMLTLFSRELTIELRFTQVQRAA
jgi:transcription termination/antitermination protein NusG